MPISLGRFPESLLDSFFLSLVYILSLWNFDYLDLLDESLNFVVSSLVFFHIFFLYLGRFVQVSSFCFQSFNSPEFIFILQLFHFYGILFFLEGITHLSDETNGSFYLFVSFGVWFTSPCIVSLSHRLLFVSLVISVLVILDAFSMSQLIPFRFPLALYQLVLLFHFVFYYLSPPPHCELPEGRNKDIYSSFCCHSRHSINVCWIEFKSF